MAEPDDRFFSWRPRSAAAETTLFTLMVVGGAVVAMFALWPDLVTRIPPMCSMRWLGGHCVGCGMTRACALLLRLDVAAAVRHNPLVIFVAPFLALKFVELLTGILTGQSLACRWPCWFTSAFQTTFIAGCMALAGVRLIAWFWPSTGLRAFCPPDPGPAA
jgi:hypothetical protein